LGYYLPKDIHIIVRNRENSIFLCRARTDTLLHVIPHYEWRTWEVIKSITTSGDIFIDVGSHIGTYTIPIARIVGHNGLVIAIEPSPISRILSLNIKLNKLKNVVVLNKAAFSKRVMLNLHFNPLMTGFSSLYKDFKCFRSQLFDISVEAIPLDDLENEIGLRLDRVKLLKIDAEGAEKDVIEGASDTLQKLNL
jgi:FkbM family methyltransferase